MSEELLVFPAHRGDCRFGDGFYRVYLTNDMVRYCQTPQDVAHLVSLVGQKYIRVVERDGHCLDGDRDGDANTPDVVDAEQWLGLPAAEAMRAVGLTSAREYHRVYAQVEAAVSRRNNRESQGGVRASIVIKKRGRRVVDA